MAFWIATEEETLRGSLHQAREWKQRTWRRVKQLRERRRNAPAFGGVRAEIALDMLRATSEHKEAVIFEATIKRKLRDIRESTNHA